MKQFHRKLLAIADSGSFPFFSYDQLTGALNGSRALSPAVRHAIEMSCKAFLEEQAALGTPSAAAPRAEQQLLPALHGPWYLIQYRSRRVSPSELVPASDLRVAVLVYGETKSGSTREFEILSSITRWRGTVQKRAEHFVFSASEITPDLADEALSMMLLGPHNRERVEHHGILLGVAHSKDDSPSYPVYASRVLLYPISGEYARWASPLTEDQKKALLAHCGYVAETGLDDFASRSTDDLHQQKVLALRRFIALTEAEENHGDRMFVRR